MFVVFASGLQGSANADAHRYIVGPSLFDSIGTVAASLVKVPACVSRSGGMTADGVAPTASFKMIDDLLRKVTRPSSDDTQIRILEASPGRRKNVEPHNICVAPELLCALE